MDSRLRGHVPSDHMLRSIDRFVDLGGRTLLRFMGPGQRRKLLLAAIALIPCGDRRRLLVVQIGAGAAARHRPGQWPHRGDGTGRCFLGGSLDPRLLLNGPVLWRGARLGQRLRRMVGRGDGLLR